MRWRATWLPAARSVRLLALQLVAQVGRFEHRQHVALLHRVAGADLQRDGAGGRRVQRRADRGDDAAVDRGVAHQRAAADFGDAQARAVDRARAAAARPTAAARSAPSADARRRAPSQPRRRWRRCRGRMAMTRSWPEVSGIMVGARARLMYRFGCRNRANAQVFEFKGFVEPTGREIRVSGRCPRRPAGQPARRRHRAKLARPRERKYAPMCGIVGISAQRPIVHHLIAGLQALEYRGYDSAGIAMLTDQRHRAAARQGQGPRPRRAAEADRPGRFQRHRPHALGHPRRAQRIERAPACLRPGQRGAQRHHRKPCGAARRTDRRRFRVRLADRHRSDRAHDRARPAPRACRCSRR